MSDLAPHPDQQEDIFDQVAYLMAIAHAAHGNGEAPPPRVYSGVAATDFSPRTAVERHAQTLVAAGLFDSCDHLTQTGDAYREHLSHYRAFGHRFRI